MNKNWYISRSKIHGRGVFASRMFNRGETIFLIKGRPVHLNVHNHSKAKIGSRWIGVGKDAWVNPHIPANTINHSCEPNTGIKGRVHVVALHTIRPNEEVTVDYSTTEIDKFWSMRCSCKARRCRGTIQSIQFLPTRTIKRYLPFVNTLFKKIYAKTHLKLKVTMLK